MLIQVGFNGDVDDTLLEEGFQWLQLGGVLCVDTQNWLNDRVL